MTSATTSSAAATAAAPSRPQGDRFIVSVALGALAVLGAFIAVETAPFLAVLLALGAVLGIALYHGAFSFTGGWRRQVVQQRSSGLRAQLALFALASVLFAPFLVADPTLNAAVAPVGTSLLLGAFLFGLGMQLGGGCGSGTMFTVGAGNIRMVLTLIFFIVGSVVGTMHLPWWLEQPGTDPIHLLEVAGPWGAVAGQLALLGLLVAWLARRERQRHGNVEPALTLRPASGGFWQTLVYGPWPFSWAVAVLGVGSLAVLLVAEETWGITFAFALWGAKILQAVGVDMAQWTFWTWDYPALALSDSVFVNITSVTNFGLFFGAMLAAGLAGRYNKASQGRIPPRSLLAAVLGGLLMGYGARLAFGCNIGALFGGIASASLHGWIWLVAAWIGSYLGVQLRPYFALAKE